MFMYVSLREEKKTCAILSNGFFLHSNIISLFLVEWWWCEKRRKKSFRIFFLHIYGRYDNITQFTFFNWSKCSKDANNTLYIRGVVKKLFYIYQMKKKIIMELEKRNKFYEAHRRKKIKSHTVKAHTNEIFSHTKKNQQRKKEISRWRNKK